MVKFIKLDTVNAGRCYVNMSQCTLVQLSSATAFTTNVEFKYPSFGTNEVSITTFAIDNSFYDYFLKAHKNSNSLSANSVIYDPTISQGLQPTINALT